MITQQNWESHPASFQLVIALVCPFVIIIIIETESMGERMNEWMNEWTVFNENLTEHSYANNLISSVVFTGYSNQMVIIIIQFTFTCSSRTSSWFFKLIVIQESMIWSYKW